MKEQIQKSVLLLLKVDCRSTEDCLCCSQERKFKKVASSIYSEERRDKIEEKCQFCHQQFYMILLFRRERENIEEKCQFCHQQFKMINISGVTWQGWQARTPDLRQEKRERSSQESSKARISSIWLEYIFECKVLLNYLYI